jgi:hypothetical protein
LEKVKKPGFQRQILAVVGYFQRQIFALVQGQILAVVFAAVSIRQNTPIPSFWVVLCTQNSFAHKSAIDRSSGIMKNHAATRSLVFPNPKTQKK